MSIDKACLFKNLMDNMVDNIYFKDVDSRFLMVNRAFCDWTNLSPGHVVGKSDFDLFTKEHAQQAYDDERHVISTGKPLLGIEEKETWPDGTSTWVSSSKVPLRDSEGNIAGTFGLSRDITEHKIAEICAVSYANEICAIKEEMEEDLRVAGELQKTFCRGRFPVFPAGAAAHDSCVEFVRRFKSCSDVSGDYCSIHRLSDTEAGIFLCDIRSAGVRAALGTALIRGIVQEISPLGLEPGAYLNRMNESLLPLLHHDAVLLDITACYLVLDVVAGTIRYASAGHPTPLHFHQEGGVRRLFDDPSVRGPSLAVQGDVVYTTAECLAEPGDSVVLFTDGLCCGKNAAGESFGKKRLLDAARCLEVEALPGILQGLEDSATVVMGGGTFTDDICLAGFQLRHLLSPSK